MILYSSEWIYDLDKYDEIFATYQDAKAKLNALRTSKGFYPVVVSLDANAKGTETRPRPASSKKGKGKAKTKNSGKGQGYQSKRASQYS